MWIIKKINFLKYEVLTTFKSIFKKIFFTIFFSHILKCQKTYWLNIPNIKKNCKKRLVKSNQSLSEGREKKWQYGHEQYRNLSKDEKQKLVEYIKYGIIKVLHNDRMTDALQYKI